MLEVASLHHNFGLRKILIDVGLKVENGEVVALFGDNGAGKTTLLRICATLQRVSHFPFPPTIKIDGFDIFRESTEVRARLGFVSHHHGAYNELSARENLRFSGELHRLDNLELRIEKQLERVNLHHRADEPVASFSAGMFQRLSLARVLLHEPTTLMLDEPFQGLDVKSSAILEDIIGAARDKEQAVLMVTHDRAQGSRIADRTLILEKGQLRPYDHDREAGT